MKYLEKFVSDIQKDIDKVLKSSSKSPHPLWQKLLSQHPIDIALVLNQLEEKCFSLFAKLPEKLQDSTFDALSIENQLIITTNLNKERVSQILQKIPANSLVYLFDHMSEDDLEKFLKLTQKKRRQAIIASLNCEPETAGRIAHTDVLTVQKDFTIKKCIALMQRLGKGFETRPRLYVKDENLRLAGYIEISDLVLNKSDTPLSHIMNKAEAYVNAYEDQERVVQLIKQYEIPSIPVVDEQHRFLGIITASSILEVIEDEMEEDSYRMSGLATTEKTYQERSFWKLIIQRSMWLAPLLLFQSVSGTIMATYQTLLQQHTVLFFFLTMLIGTGGNAGNQSATLVVRGLVTGEINRKNLFSVILKELGIAFFIAAIMIIFGIMRIVLTSTDPITIITICLSLFGVVFTSILLGTLIPMALHKMGIDPAHSAAPFLSTLMDIIGTLMYFGIASMILGT